MILINKTRLFCPQCYSLLEGIVPNTTGSDTDMYHCSGCGTCWRYIHPNSEGNSHSWIEQIITQTAYSGIDNCR